MMRKTLTREQYARQYQPRHDAVFRAGPVEEGPFANPRWRMVLLTGGLLLDPDVFAALAAAARQHGDHEVVVLDRDGHFPEDPPVLLAWDPHAWDEARCTVLGHVDTDVFGASGAWGMVASDGFAVLGGEASFLAAFEGALTGGQRVLRERFAEAAGNGIDFFGEAGRRHAARLMAMVGWDEDDG